MGGLQGQLVFELSKEGFKEMHQGFSFLLSFCRGHDRGSSSKSLSPEPL